MDSSPRPLRRFSRWKTSKCTFVLGGKKYGTGNEDKKQNNVKAVSSRDFRKSKLRSSPRSPYSRRLSLHNNRQTKESTVNKTSHTDINCKAVVDSSQDSEETSLGSKSAQASIDFRVSPPPHALSVLSPNVSTAKDVQADSSPNKHCDIVENNLETVKTTECDSECQINHIESRIELEANPDSPSVDKENSSTVVSAQADTLSKSEVQKAREPVTSQPNQSKDTDDKEEDQTPRSCSRRQTLRNRSLLKSSSAVLMQKNYPFSKSSSKKRTIERNIQKNVNGQRLSTNVSTQKRKKHKDLVSKVSSESDENHSQSTKMSTGEKKTKSLTPQEKEDVKLSMNTSVDLIDVNSASPNTTQSVVPQSSRHPKSDHTSVIPKSKNAKKSPSESKTNRARQKASNSHSLSRSSSKKKQGESVKEKCRITRGSVRSNPEEGNEKADQSQSNKKKSDITERKSVPSFRKDSVPITTAQGIASTSLNSSNRSLRNRCHLATPEMQYPAVYMSASQIKVLSDKAKSVLSISKNFSLASPKSPTSPSARSSKNQSDKLKDGATKQAAKKAIVKSKQGHSSPQSNELSKNPVILKIHGKGSKGQKKKPIKNPKTSKLPIPTSTANSKEKTQGENVENNAKNGHRKRHEISEQSVSENSHFEKKKESSHSLKHSTATGIKMKTSHSSPLKSQQQGKGSQASQERYDNDLQDMGQDDEMSLVILKEGSRQIHNKSKVHQMKKLNASKSFKSKELPGSSQNGNEGLNETAFGGKKPFKRRKLFEDSASDSKKLKFSRNMYENGRDVLLWSENGEERKGSSVTSLDVIFTDVIQLEDRLKDSETENLHQRLIGKVLGPMKRFLKTQINQLETAREFKADVRNDQQSCDKLKAEIMELEEKDKRLHRKLMRTKESEQKAVQAWMKNFKSFIVSTRIK